MRTRMLLAGVGLVLMVSAAQGEWKLSGYTQVRYNVWDQDIDDREFDFRRVYLKAEGPVFDEATTLRLQVDFSGLDDANNDVDLKDAMITRKFGPNIKGAFGFGSVPFGYEVPASNSALLPLERSEAAKRFFPGERASGFWFAYHPKPVGRRVKPQFDLVLTNGLGKWYDTDAAGDHDEKSSALFGRVQVPIVGSSGVAGLSYMAARRERSVGGVATALGAEDIFGAHARYEADCGVAVTGEYYTGQILNEDTSGWYAQAECKLRRARCTLFYRFDTCDRATKPVDFQRHTAGVAWEPRKDQRITLQVEAIDGYKYAANSVANWGVQYQIKY